MNLLKRAAAPVLTLMLLALLMAALTVSASAKEIAGGQFEEYDPAGEYDETTGDWIYSRPIDLYWSLDSDGTLTITGSVFLRDYGDMGGMPESYPWYSYRDQIKAVVIEDGVTGIGSNAFQGCTNLASVEIPASVTTIDEAFESCSNLKEINYLGSFGKWVEMDLPEWGNPFDYGAALYINGEIVEGDLVIPDGATRIGNYILNGCSRLTSVTIPEGVSSIGNGVFQGYDSLSYVVIPKSVNSIKSCAFGDYWDEPAEDDNYSGIDQVFYLGSEEEWKLINIEGENSRLTNAPRYYNVKTGSLGEDLRYFLVPDNGLLLITGTGEMPDLTGKKAPWNDMRDSIKTVSIGDGVTNIGKNAFRDCTGLTSITIPDSVTAIGDNAFLSCTGLTNVVIPESVETIGDSAFRSCTGLNTAVILEGTTSVGPSAFRGCANLNTVIIPSSVTEIGDSAFTGCGKLAWVYYLGSESAWQKVDLTNGNVRLTGASIHYGEIQFGNFGDGMSYIFLPDTGELIIMGSKTITAGEYDPEMGYWDGNSPWNGFRDQIETLTIKNGVTGIGDDAFNNCTNLTSVEIPATVSSIGSWSFNNCSSLTKINYLGDLKGWIGISQNPMGDEYDGPEEDTQGRYLLSLNSETVLIIGGKEVKGDIVIPDGTERISDYAFAGYTKLTSVTIPEGVTAIGNNAFRDCGSMTHVVLPTSLTSVGSYAFYLGRDDKGIWDEMIEEYYYSNATLGWVYYLGDEAGWKSIKIESGNNLLTNAPRHYGDYYTGPCGENLTYTFDPDTGTLTIAGTGKMTDYSIAAPWIIFKNSLTSVSLPDALESIGQCAFSGCEKLKHVTIPEDVDTMGQNAFRDCPLLKTAGPAGGKYDIEFNWFRVLPAYTFYGANYLEKLVLPDTLLKAGYYSFAYCPNLSKLVVPKGMELIGTLSYDRQNDTWNYDHGQYGDGRMFDGCTSLTSVGGPKSGCAIEIPWEGFYLEAFIHNNPNLKQVVIPKKVTVISSYLMEGCTGLETFTVPDQITRIESYAFNRCTGLKEVKFPAALTYIGDYAFYECSQLKDVTFSEGLTSIHSYAFSRCTSLETVVLPSSLASLGYEAFAYCNSLKEISLPSGMTTMGEYTFRECNSLETVSLPGFVGQSDGMFYGCSGLREVRFSGGVSYIGGNSFVGCKKMKVLYLPLSVTSIDKNAFFDCEKLMDVYYSGTEDDWNRLKKSGIKDGNKFLTTARIHCGENVTGKAKAEVKTIDVERKWEEQYDPDTGEYLDGKEIIDVQVQVHCEPKVQAFAYGAKYASDGRFLAFVSVKLKPGEDTMLTIPAEDSTTIRIFTVDYKTLAPLGPTANLAVGAEMGEV